MPIVRCDDQIFNTVIKREHIDEADHKYDDEIVYNTVIKQEIIDEKNHDNEDQLSQIG